MKKLLMLFSLLLSFTAAFAQTQTVKGVVTEASTGDPIIGATVMAKGTSVGTVTDIDGRYTINVPAKSKKLVFTYVGMLPVEMDVKPEVNVAME